jgi:hypothetical protein
MAIKRPLLGERDGGNRCSSDLAFIETIVILSLRFQSQDELSVVGCFTMKL